MAACRTIQLTLPTAMAEEFDRVRRTEKRTPSGLVREAVESYLSFLRDFPAIPPKPAERRAIRQGREAYARGEYIGLDELIQKMGPGGRQNRGKKSDHISRKG